jgi:hypothetical protein
LLYALVHRKTKTMKASQFELIFLFLLGLLLLSLTPVAFLGAPNHVSCVGRIWYINLSLSLTNGALVVKMWRVWKLFMNKTMKRQILTTVKMIQYVCCFVVFEMLLLVVMTAVPALNITPLWVDGSVVFPKLLPTGKAVHGLCLGGLEGTAGNTTFFTVSVFGSVVTHDVYGYSQKVNTVVCCFVVLLFCCSVVLLFCWLLFVFPSCGPAFNPVTTWVVLGTWRIYRIPFVTNRLNFKNPNGWG